MATLRLDVYATLLEELDRLSGDEAPRWATRLYTAYGHPPPDVPLSLSVHALSEGLQLRLKSLSVLLDKAEDMGWHARVEEDHIMLSTGLPAERSEDLLERSGVLTVARFLAPAGPGGELAWGEELT